MYSEIYLMNLSFAYGQVQEAYIETDDGGEIAVYSKGEGRTVLLLHGAGGSASHFHFLFRRLSARNLRVRHLWNPKTLSPHPEQQ